MEAVWRRAAAYVLCRDARGRILLTRFVTAGHPDTGRWTMPGGGMEWGEHPVDTAARELEEETGLRGRIGAVVGVHSRWFEPHETPRRDPGHVLGIVFEGLDVTGDIRSDFEGTTDAAQWFTIDEVRALPTVELVDVVLAILGERGGADG